MVTESLLAVVGPTTFVVRKLNGEGIECAMPRHRGATVADIIWNLTSADPILFNLIGTSPFIYCLTILGVFYAAALGF
jgi:hypothetical protein